MTSTPFCLSATLATPVVLTPQTFLVLDSLLLHALRVDRQDAGVDDIPLMRDRGVFAGSAAFLDSVAKSGGAAFKRSVTGGTLKREDFVFPAGRRPHVDQLRGPYKASLDGYTRYEAEAVVWYGNGDPQACLSLLNAYAPAVGKKCRQGYGQVSSWRVIPLDDGNDLSMSVMFGGRRIPTRPIPVAAWRAMGESSDGLLVGPHAVSLPYWNNPQTACVLPSSRLRFWMR